MAKNEISKGLLASIRTGPSRAGEGARPLEVALDLIDPDPDQPRRNIKQAELEAMAETIRRYGIQQPIVLRRSGDKRWIIETGERRWRAAKLAGLATVPAIESKNRGGADDRTALQVIENQHRAALTNTELADAIDTLTTGKVSSREVAMICGVHEQHVKFYRAVQKMPDALKQWADRLDVRTVYELYLAWDKDSGEGRGVIESRLAAIEDNGSLSLTDARRIIKSITSGQLAKREMEVPKPEVAVPDASMVAAVTGILHIPQADNVPSERSVATQDRGGEAAALRGLVRMLTKALDTAADALEATDRKLADDLRRRALEAKEQVDDGGNARYAEAVGK